MAKPKQTELSGFERPKLERVETAAIAVREIEDEIRLQREGLVEAVAELQEAMLEQRAMLEQDDQGRHVYVYQDGEDRYITRLVTSPESHKVSVSRVPMRPELRVVK
jgi:hypothetical protein